MIDLTPLEVRKKKGDFRRTMRGYDPAMVDDFLDLVADRLDELVRDNLSLTERVTRQEQQVGEYRERERALTEALVTAQEMREEIRRQSAQEAELARRTAEQEVKQLRSVAEGEAALLRTTAQQEAAQLRSAAQQETAQLRSTVQQETSQMKARVQQEVSELRTTVRQEREREEEALRVIRARQQQFLTAYRAFLTEELNELNGITRALGLSAAAGEGAPVPAGTPTLGDGPSGGTRADSMAGDSTGATLAGAGLAAGALAAAALELGEVLPGPLDAAPPELDGIVEEEDPVSAGFPLTTDLSEAYDEDLLYQPEPFEPEPYEPDPLQPDSGLAGLRDSHDGDVPAWGLESVAGDADDDFGLAPIDVDEEAVSLAGGDPVSLDDPLKLYDEVAADGGDGVPGPIGLGGGTWTDEPVWHVDGVDLVPEDSSAGLEAGAGTGGEPRAEAEPASESWPKTEPASESWPETEPAWAAEPETEPDRPVVDSGPFAVSGFEEDGEDVDELLRNAAAAGYSLEDLDEVDELLLDDVLEDAGEQEGDDGWLPGLLEDEK